MALYGVELVCFFSETQAKLSLKDTLNILSAYIDHYTEIDEKGNELIETELSLSVDYFVRSKEDSIKKSLTH